jgi:hypothetical protein
MSTQPPHEQQPPNADSYRSVEPAQTPANLGQDAKYCPRCPGWYRLEDITAESADGTIRTTADKVVLRVASPVKARRPILGSWRRKSPTLSKAQRATIAAKSFTLKCVKNHELINSPDPTVVVGVIGNVGSSKTHYLAGLVYEIIHEERLKRLGADVAYIGDTGKAMDQRINAIYVNGEVLLRTEGGEISGPFSYKLTRNLGASAERKEVLTFFDAAGEDCTGEIARSADFVRYIFDATGVIVLIDPGGLPDPENRLAPRDRKMKLTTRAIIDDLANGLEAVTGRSPKEQRHIICIAIAKADSLTLPPDVWPTDAWPSGPGRHIAPAKARRLLKEYSDRCRSALSDAGGQAIVSAAEARFSRDRVFYSAVSATSQEPLDGKWQAPHPKGCSIPLAQTLWFASNE